MRVLIDSNVLISAALFTNSVLSPRGTPVAWGPHWLTTPSSEGAVDLVEASNPCQAPCLPLGGNARGSDINRKQDQPPEGDGLAGGGEGPAKTIEKKADPLYDTTNTEKNVGAYLSRAKDHDKGGYG